MRMTKIARERVVRRRPHVGEASVGGDGATQRVYKKYLPQIQKRDGRIVPFEFSKIIAAIEKSMKA